MSSFFDPPQNPQDGEGYTFGNVVWQFDGNSGVWNIKDGTLVGTDGVGVSGFRIDGSNLKFYYVYPDGLTSQEINLGNVVGADGGGGGLTFRGSDNTTDSVSPGETFTITGAGPTVRTSVSGNTMTVDVRLATDALTGVARFSNADFTVSTGLVTLNKTTNGIIIRDSFGTNEQLRVDSTLTITGGTGVFTIRTGDDSIAIRGHTASSTVLGVASFNPVHFDIVSGNVSLSGSYNSTVTGDTVTGPNASIKVTKSGNLATIDARLATDSLTGVASFNNTHFGVADGAVSLAAAYQVTGDTVTGPNAAITVTKSGRTATIDARLATSGATGVASFNGTYFDVVNGAVSLSAAYQATGDTVTGPNAAITVTKSGRTATIDARLATSGATGVASFNGTYFDVVNGAVSLSAAYQVTGDTVTGPNAAITVTKSGRTATIDARLATSGATGVARFPTADFAVDNGSVSLTAGLVRSVNGVTGDVAKGTPANRVFYSNTATGLTTSSNFLFDGNGVTFAGGTFAFGVGTTEVIGGVFSKHKEKGFSTSIGPSQSSLTINPNDGFYQKVRWDTSSLSNGTLLTVGVDNSGSWATTSNQVESIVVVIQQIGKGLSAAFASSILNEGRQFLGSTGSVDVITITRYAVSASLGLTMGFVVSRGMTSTGFNF